MGSGKENIFFNKKKVSDSKVTDRGCIGEIGSRYMKMKVDKILHTGNKFQDSFVIRIDLTN